MICYLLWRINLSMWTWLPLGQHTHTKFCWFSFKPRCGHGFQALRHIYHLETVALSLMLTIDVSFKRAVILFLSWHTLKEHLVCSSLSASFSALILLSTYCSSSEGHSPSYLQWLYCFVWTWHSPLPVKAAFSLEPCSLCSLILPLSRFS